MQYICEKCKNEIYSIYYFEKCPQCGTFVKDGTETEVQLELPLVFN
jgi:Zn finger protein HypA/HybF involved in hydrogenase expression